MVFFFGLNKVVVLLGTAEADHAIRCGLTFVTVEKRNLAHITWLSASTAKKCFLGVKFHDCNCMWLSNVQTYRLQLNRTF